MPGLLDLCNTYFGFRNFYEVLKIEKSADEKQIRKAYHKLSLLVHPDRVQEKEKTEATEKFKVLGKIYSILSNKEKKSIYDETGVFDEDDEEWDDNLGAFFLFKKITDEDINNYEKNYKGSELELTDLRKAYVNGKGDMDYILEVVPFSHTNEEDRLREVIQGLIDSGEVPEFDCFVNEPPENRIRREKKAKREAALYEKLKKKENKEKEDIGGLAVLLKRKQQERGVNFDSFIDNLTAKYGKTKTPKAGNAKKKSKK